VNVDDSWILAVLDLAGLLSHSPSGVEREDADWAFIRKWLGRPGHLFRQVRIDLDQPLFHGPAGASMLMCSVTTCMRIGRTQIVPAMLLFRP
jgi:hypothetical protein